MIIIRSNYDENNTLFILVIYKYNNIVKILSKTNDILSGILHRNKHYLPVLVDIQEKIQDDPSKVYRRRYYFCSLHGCMDVSKHNTDLLMHQ